MTDEEYDYDDELGMRVGRWTTEEHNLFIQGINQFGREWDKVQSVVKTRSLAQIRSHAQKYFLKLSRSEELERIYEEGLWSLSEGQGSNAVDTLTVLDFMSHLLDKLKNKRQRLEDKQDNSIKQDEEEEDEHNTSMSSSSIHSSTQLVNNHNSAGSGNTSGSEHTTSAEDHSSNSSNSDFHHRSQQLSLAEHAASTKIDKQNFIHSATSECY